MKMSVREARAQFAAAIALAERGEAVIVTRNGKPVAQIAPPPAVEKRKETSEEFWARLDRVRKDLGLDKIPPYSGTADDWIEEHRAWRRELFGPQYFYDEPAATE